MSLADWSSPRTTSGALTRETLDAAFKAIERQGATPRHVCRLDGHVLHWNPYGFARCLHCGASEADVGRD